MSTTLLTLLFALAVGCMTAAATSVRSVSWIWLRHWAEQQLAGEPDQAAPALARPHQYLLAAGTGVASLVFGLGAVLAFREDRSNLVREIALATLLLLVVGQLVPRAIARRWATTLIPALMPLLKVLDALFGPILSYASRLVRPLVKPVVAGQAPEASDPLEDLLREAELEGFGEAGESEIISGVAEFGEKRVRDVMTPRDKMTSVTPTMAAADIAQVVAQSNYTRIPVIAAGTGEVSGIVHAFDVLARPDQPLATLRAVSAAAADETCGVLMRRMLRERRQLAVVRSESGDIAGIVTLEDLMEELVGEIRDEHDEPGSTS